MDTIVTAVEKLGGWAVVVWIVWWMTTKSDKKMAALISEIGRLVEGLQSHTEDEGKHYEELHRAVRDGTEATKDLLAEFRAQAGRPRSSE